jgi:RHH-type transcriptional regulator, rel operon repressor / antitoxin RelB
MEPTTEGTTTITTRIPQSLRADLDALAKATGRNRNNLMEEALRRFVDVERWQIALIEDRVRQADAGNFASDEEVDRVYAKFKIQRRNPSERVAG